MKKLVLLLVMLLAVVCPAEIKAQEQLESAFAGAEVNSGGVLRLKSTDAYLKLKEDARKTAVEGQAKAHSGTAVAVVEYQGNGELWTVAGSSAVLADSWSRKEMRFGQHARKAGRWFGYVGGQFVRGGDSPSNNWTGRVGTTLFKDRYDTALSFSRNSLTAADDAMTTIGLIMRVLYPYTQHAGFNLGLQLDRTSYTGYNHISPSAIGGINIYLPGGSFDVSLSCGEEGRMALLAGYTVYIGK